MSVWAITGATRGLGQAVAQQLLREGHRIVFCARSQDDVARVQAEFSAHGPAVGAAGSITDPDFVRRWLNEAAQSSGALAGVVLNAAVLGSPPLSLVENLSTESLIATFTVNVAGNIQVLQSAASHWDSASSPTVIAFTSDAESAGYEGWASYGSSKAALNLIIKTYQSEHPNHHVYVVDPGDMDTAMHREALPDDPGPLRRPLDVARALSPLWSAPPPSGRYIIHGSTEVLTLKKEG